MKKKNLITAAVSLALVAVVGVGATLAYFTDKTETAQNVFSAGKVSLSLIDKSEPEEGQVGGEPYEKDGITGIQYDNIMPGDVLSKVVGLNTAADSQDAYVAIRVTVNDVVAPNAQSIGTRRSPLRSAISSLLRWMVICGPARIWATATWSITSRLLFPLIPRT